jgi:hypothetical protein
MHKKFNLAAPFLSAFFLLLFCPFLLAQPENKIRDAIENLTETHPLRIAIFRVQPTLIIGSAYDSNAFSTSVIEASDYYGSIAPGASVVLKMGYRAYFVFQENVNFVFYNEQDQLNDIFDTTSGMFGIGSRRLLFNVGGSYYNKKARINEEFDQPADQQLTDVNADLSIAIRKRTDVHFLFRHNKSLYQLDEEVPTDLPITPDSETFEYGAGFDEEIGNVMRFAAGASTGNIRFLNLTSPSGVVNPVSDFWRSLAGLEFRGNQLAGRARLGFGHTESIDITGESFNDFIIDTDVVYELGKRLSIGGLLKRARSISGLSETNFRLTTQGGVKGCAPLNKRRELFVDGMWVIGQNDYDEKIVIEDQPITKDTFQKLESGVNFVLPKNFVFRFGTSYQNRDSNIPTLTKDRFTFNIGVALETRRHRVTEVIESCTPVALYE